MNAIVMKLQKLMNDLILLIALMMALFMLVLFINIITTHKQVIKNINECLNQEKIIEKEGVC